MPFSDIPIRSNQGVIDASWFNTIRLFLIQLLGDVQGEEAQSIGDTDTNQYADGLSELDGSEFTKIDIEYKVDRESTALHAIQSGFFTMHKKDGTWEMHGDEQNIFGDDAKISFSLFQASTLITLRYSTTTIGGSGHVGALTMRAKKWVT